MKCIALTYDDGPFPDEAGALVETLRQYKVKATFFMLGQNVENYPDTVKDIAATGSELANHSWSHASLPTLGNSGMRRELKRTNDAIAEVTGVQPTLMRPPYGANNKRLDKVCREARPRRDLLGCRHARLAEPRHRTADHNVLDNAARNQVVLMHDIHPTHGGGGSADHRGPEGGGLHTGDRLRALSPSSGPAATTPNGRDVDIAKKSDYPPRKHKR